MPVISLSPTKSKSLSKQRHSKRNTNVLSSSFWPFTKVMVLEKKPMEYSDLPHKRVLSIEKRIISGLSTIMESLQSQSSHSLWHHLSKTISLMLSSEGTILHRSSEENKAFKLSRITQEITNQTSGLGQWIQKTYYMMANLYNTVSRLKHTQQSLTQEARS